MPSTPSTRLRAELQALGENLSTWGDTRLNEALKRLEDGIAQVFTKAVTANYTLTASNYVADEARAAVLVLTGTPGATFKITIPGVTKTYFVINKTNAAQTIGTSGGAVASVPAGRYRWVYCDATDTFTDDPSISQLPKPTGNIDMSSVYTFTNLPDGVAAQSPTTKAQLDALKAYAQGLSNSGILAPGSVDGKFLQWSAALQWHEASVPTLVPGTNTTVSGNFDAGTMAVNVDLSAITTAITALQAFDDFNLALTVSRT